LFDVLGVLGFGHLIDAKDESHLWANLHAAASLCYLHREELIATQSDQ